MRCRDHGTENEAESFELVRAAGTGPLDVGSIVHASTPKGDFGRMRLRDIASQWKVWGTSEVPGSAWEVEADRAGKGPKMAPKAAYY